MSYGYQPTSYPIPNQDFWGTWVLGLHLILWCWLVSSLVDPNGYPSVVFIRLVDSLFFMMDSQSEVYRYSGRVEFGKLMWMWVALDHIKPQMVCRLSLWFKWLMTRSGIETSGIAIRPARAVRCLWNSIYADWSEFFSCHLIWTLICFQASWKSRAIWAYDWEEWVPSDVRERCA